MTATNRVSMMDLYPHGDRLAERLLDAGAAAQKLIDNKGQQDPQVIVDALSVLVETATEARKAMRAAMKSAGVRIARPQPSEVKLRKQCADELFEQYLQHGDDCADCGETVCSVSKRLYEDYRTATETIYADH